ncbi:YIP1 family protein [Rubrobacter tropicus]|uniref:YIP1 family protein n=1 Tax=Rubrobacter tropicus TaxID=2653851 RepID=UPI00140E8137|nr:YIP1 family protein [Rubrobacter tropicus]
MIWNPIRALRGVAERRSALPGFVVVAVYAALGLVVSTVFVLSGATRRQLERGFEQPPGQPALPPEVIEPAARAAEIGIPVIALVSPFVGWIFVSSLMQLATRLFGGTGPFSSMLGVVGVAQAPFFVSSISNALLGGLRAWMGVGTPAGVAIGYLVSLIGLACFMWYVVLVVIGASQASGVGYGESAGSCALSCAGLAALIILLVVVVGIGIFAVAGAAAQ